MAGETPIDTSADAPSDVNLRFRWPFWAKNAEWRDKLSEEMYRKSLDLPKDDMNINQQGISGKSAMGIAGIAGGMGVAGALGTALLLGAGESSSSASAEVSSPPAVVAPVNPADSEYDVLFYDKDGNPIQVPRISTRPKAE